MSQPSDPAESIVRAHLSRLGVAHSFMDCDPELADTVRFCEAYGVAAEDSANTIVVVGKPEPVVYVACVVLANTRLDVNNAVRRRLGVRKASFASADQTRELTGMLIGGVTAFGLPDGMAVWVDSRVMERPEIVLGGGSRSCKLRCAPSALLALANVERVEGLASPAGSEAQTR
jgi:prolyl-tRNA editing enzyme YbaK/EbsC (Cys-tRNA(Pro) deacylase)